MEKHYSNAHSRLNAEAEEGPLYFLVIESLGPEEKKVEKEIGWHLFITPTVCQWCVRTSANTLTLSSLSFSLSLSHTHTHTQSSLSHYLFSLSLGAAVPATAAFSFLTYFQRFLFPHSFSLEERK